MSDFDKLINIAKTQKDGDVGIISDVQSDVQSESQSEPDSTESARMHIDELLQAEILFNSLSKKRHGKRRQRLWNTMEALRWVLGKERK